MPTLLRPNEICETLLIFGDISQIYTDTSQVLTGLLLHKSDSTPDARCVTTETPSWVSH